jgi:hypothetical protein
MPPLGVISGKLKDLFIKTIIKNETFVAKQSDLSEVLE